MLPESPKLILHSNLEKSEIIEAGWSFKYLTDEDKAKVRDINCLEIRIDGLKDNDVLYEQANRLRTKIAGHIFDGRLGNSYLVLTEYQSLPKNKIRSYKGLFPSKGQIKKGDFLEFEFEWGKGETFFIGIAPITKDNRAEIYDFAKDYLRAFILTSGESPANVYTQEFLESIISCLNIKGNIIIDSMRLVPKVCSQGLMIFEFASSQNGDHVNIRSFYPKVLTDFVEYIIGQAVS